MPPKRSAPSGPSQAPAQRRRPAVADETSSEDEAFQGEQEGEGGTQAASGHGLGETVLKRKAAQLVRMALFFEYRRNPIKRGDVMKLVLPSQARAFNAVLERTQKILRNTFGMELVELRGKRKGAAEPVANGATQAGPSQMKGKRRAIRNGAGSEEEEEEEGEEEELAAGKKRARSAGTKSYILRSVLPADIVAAMANPIPLPMFDANGEEAGNEDESADSGALLRWEKADGTASGNVGSLGLRTVILCLVMCLGRVIQDDDDERPDHLHALLRRLNLHRDTVLPYTSTDSKEPPMTLDKYLELLDRHHYLEKIRIAGPNGMGEGHTVEWRWGNREAEFSEKAAAAFIEKMSFLNDAESSESSENEAPQTRRGRAGNGQARDRVAEKEKARMKLREDIAKAAGGPLTGVE